jgi:hypothetical protein
LAIKSCKVVDSGIVVFTMKLLASNLDQVPAYYSWLRVISQPFTLAKRERFGSL